MKSQYNKPYRLKRLVAVAALLASLAACSKKDAPNEPAPEPPVSGGNNGQPFVSTDVLPINPSIVSRCFNGMQMTGKHPRLLFTSEEIAAIKSRSNGDPFTKGTYDEVIAKANTALSAAPITYQLDGANLRLNGIHQFSNDQVPFLVLAYQFTKNTAYAKKCMDQVERMITWADWGANRHFLDAGIAAKAMALIYDGLNDYLSTAQKNTIEAATKKFILDPAKTAIETNSGPFKWWLSNDNWNGICFGGILMSSLALYENNPSYYGSLIATSANGMLKYIQSLDPDGASEEGMSYWSYGISNTFLALESLKKVLSTTFGLTSLDGIKKTGWFPYLVSGPVGTASFGDDYLYFGKNNKFLSYFWFSHHLNDANLARYHYESCLSVNSNKNAKMNGWTDLLFYNPTLAQSGSASSLPLQGKMKGVDYFYIRENNAETALYVGMHGGSNAASHGHLDAGTFFIMAQGENFAVGNLGLENPYPSDYFRSTAPNYTDAPTQTISTTGRLHYYKVKTEGKSCLVFNPDARPEQDPQGEAVLAKEGADANGGFYILNMTNVYRRDVSNYQRGIKLNRSTGVITVQDEFVASTGGTVYWIMQSPSVDNIILSSDGKSATMNKNGKLLYLTLQSPAQASFQVVPRSESSPLYLPETAPIFQSLMAGKNTANRWYGKLQIKLESVPANTVTTIKVDFSKQQGQTSSGLQGLNNWTTTN